MNNQKKRKDNDVAVLPMRYLGVLVAKFFYKIGITPIQVTAGSFIVFAPIIFYFLSRGEYVSSLIALALIFATIIFDLSDGALAKLRGIYSHRGTYLDSSLDKIFQYLILLALTVGVFRSTVDSTWLFWGMALLITQGMADYVGAKYEREFDFDAYSGSVEFLKKFEGAEKIGLLDDFLKNIIVPCRQSFIFVFTLRYWLVLGLVLNHPELFLIIATITLSIRWIAMWLLYLSYLDSVGSRLKTITFLKELKRD